MHYQRAVSGRPMDEPGPLRRANTPENFWARTEPDGACRVWTGFTDRDGYGKVGWEGRKVYAHRLAFFLRMDRWPEGTLRHLCNNPPCVLHVVEGTHTENMEDMRLAGRARNAKKTHCPQGHPYTKRHKNVDRLCDKCITARNRLRSASL